MRYYLKLNHYIAIVTSFIVIGCTLNNDTTVKTIDTAYVSIEIDTIALQADADLPTDLSFMFNNKFYLLCDRENLTVFDRFGCLQISPVSVLPDGLVRENRKVAYAINNDSLFIMNESGRVYFFNKESGMLEYGNKQGIFVFEDDRYNVLKTSRTRYGDQEYHFDMVYFIDKETHKIFRAYFYDIISVNKFQGKYYIISHSDYDVKKSHVFEIEDPRILQECSEGDMTYSDLNLYLKERYDYDRAKSIIDTSHVNIIGSFIHRGRLLFLCNEYDDDFSSSKLYFSELADGKLERRYTFDEPMEARFLYGSEMDKSSHLFNLRLYTESRKEFAMMTVDNEKIKIRFLKCSHN